MNFAFWRKPPPVIQQIHGPPPPPKPNPFHAGGRITNIASPKFDLPFSWNGSIDYSLYDTEEYEPFMKMVPYDERPIVDPHEIGTLQAARNQGDYQGRHLYMNPMQDLDYMKIKGVTKNSFAGPLMDSFTKFVVGTGFYPELELVEPTNDPDKNKRILEEHDHVIQALRSIDRQFDFNSSGYLDVSLTALISQLISGANIFNRAALVFRHGDKPIEILGKKYPKIPTVMNYVHPQELGLIETDNIGRLVGVSMYSDFNMTPANEMIYLWNPLISAKYEYSKWYGGSMVLPMLDALQTMRKIHGVDLPTMARVAWAGLYLLTVKPQGQTQETKMKEYAQIASALQKPGSTPILMEDPEDTKLDKIDYEPKVKEFSDVAEHLIRYCVACLQLPVSMFFDESSSNRSCYSADTLTLTEEGWKGYQEIDYTKDKIATLNPDTNKIEFHVPDGVYIGHYKGKMIHIKTKNQDIMVTPDHDMWVTRSHDPQFIRWEKVKAGKLTEKSEWNMLGFGEWEGNPVPEMYPLETVEHKLKYAVKQVHAIPTDLWIEFIGYYLSEGTKSRPEKHGNSYFVSIAQNIDSPYSPRMQEVMDAMPFHYSNTNSDGTNRWRISSKQLVHNLRDTGDLHDTKQIPKWMKDMQPDKLQILLDSLIAGDGSISKHGTRVYYTTSYQLAQDVQEIAMKIGYGATIKLQYKGITRYNGKGECADGYRVFINKNKTHMRRIRRTDITEEDYDGMIYCYNVKNHVFVTSRNGCVTVQGNTMLGKIQLAVSTAIDPVRQVLAEQLNAQWYMRHFEMIFKDQPEWNVVRPKFIFKDLHIDQWYDKVAAANEIDARHPLLDKAYGDTVGIADYVLKIDPSKPTTPGGSVGMGGGKIKGSSELNKNKSKGEGDR